MPLRLFYDILAAMGKTRGNAAKKSRGAKPRSTAVVLGICAALLLCIALLVMLGQFRKGRLVLGYSRISQASLEVWTRRMLPDAVPVSESASALFAGLFRWNRPDLEFGEPDRRELAALSASPGRGSGSSVLLGFDPFVLIYNRGVSLEPPTVADLLGPGRRIVFAGAEDADLSAFLRYMAALRIGPTAFDDFSKALSRENPAGGGFDLNNPHIAAVAEMFRDLKNQGILEPAWYDTDLIALRDALSGGAVDMVFCAYSLRRTLSPLQAFQYRTAPLPYRDSLGRLSFPIRALSVRIVPRSPAAAVAETALRTLSSQASLRLFSETTEYLAFTPAGPFLNRDHREQLALLVASDPVPVQPETADAVQWGEWLSLLRTYMRSQ